MFWKLRETAEKQEGKKKITTSFYRFCKGIEMLQRLKPSILTMSLNYDTEDPEFWEGS